MKYMEKSRGMEKVLFVGGRRGLGHQVFKLWQNQFPEHSLAISSRHAIAGTTLQSVKCDLSQSADREKLFQFVRSFKPTRVFCFAGGPHGPFAAKAWKDHKWGLEVSLLAPMELLHISLQIPELKQVILVGSAIAESQPDPNAASYCAAKHGLFGLVSTLQSESISKDIRLFSPGYMATDMLPAPARAQKKVADPINVAGDFVAWALNQEASWHRLYQPD
jgi:short-subunit dehydrogenase